MLYVFDTYVTTKSGKIMHFDVVIPNNDHKIAIDSANHWLESIGEQSSSVEPSQCVFCHSVQDQAELSRSINMLGYAIYKLEGCPA